MAVLKNVEISWVKLEQDNPDMGFDGDSPTWQLTATVDKKFADKWRKDKLPGCKENDDGSFRIIFKRKANTLKSGKEKEAPKCLDSKLRPVDPTIIGNGTVANIQYSVYDWEYANKKGKAADLMGIQVLKLVKYEGGDGNEFEVEDNDTEFSEESNDDIPFEPDADVDDGDMY